MTRRIQSTYLDDYYNDEYPAKIKGTDVDIWDMSKGRDVYQLLLGYGNGVFLESRIVGESVDALMLFRSLMQRGGYQQVEPPRHSWLYQPGDECFGHIVFIDPTPRPELFQEPDKEEEL